MIEKTWYYKDGGDREPNPVLIIKKRDFGDFFVVSFRQVLSDGKLSETKNINVSNINGNGHLVFGFNEGVKFPEIRDHYCKCCGYLDK